MANYSDLRAIALGYDVTLVEAVGGQALLMDEGANLQAIKVRTSATAKSAKEHMRAAKKASAENDKQKALKEYDAAIADLEKLKEECKEIEDDNAMVYFIECFVKAFIPIFAGTLLATSTGGASYYIGIITAYVLGMSKSLNYSAAVSEKLTPTNKAGVGGKADNTQWWKMGVTRGDAIVRFERMITACKKAKAELNKR